MVGLGCVMSYMEVVHSICSMICLFGFSALIWIQC